MTNTRTIVGLDIGGTKTNLAIFQCDADKLIIIKKTVFKNSQLEEVDFTDCDLASSHFENCNLAQARFENTILEKADFRTSYNYSIDPEINRIKRAKFSLNHVTGLLHKYDIEIDRTK